MHPPESDATEDQPRPRRMSMGVLIALIFGIGTAVWVAFGNGSDASDGDPAPSASLPAEISGP